MTKGARATTVRRMPASWGTRKSLFRGSRVRIAVDSTIPGSDLYGGLNTLQPGATIALHWHGHGEIQYIRRGRAMLLHADGNESPVSAGDAVFSPAGPAAAHGYRNTGRGVLEILFFYPTPGGRPPSVNIVARSGTGRGRPGAT